MNQFMSERMSEGIKSLKIASKIAKMCSETFQSFYFRCCDQQLRIYSTLTN